MKLILDSTYQNFAAGELINLIHSCEYTREPDLTFTLKNEYVDELELTLSDPETGLEVSTIIYPSESVEHREQVFLDRVKELIIAIEAKIAMTYFYFEPLS